MYLNELVIHNIRKNVSAIFHNFLSSCCKIRIRPEGGKKSLITLSLSVPLNYVRGQCFQQLSAVQWCHFGHLTAYTPEHDKNWIGRRLKTAPRRPPFYYSTFPIFICSQKAVCKSPTRLPPLVRRYTIRCAMVPLWAPNRLHSRTWQALNWKKTQDRPSAASLLLLNISYFHMLSKGCM